MLFNKDIQDVIADVRFETLVIAEIENSEFFAKYIEFRKSKVHKKDFWYAILQSSKLCKNIYKDKVTLEWTLEVVHYYYQTDETINLFDGPIYELALIAGDTEKILGLDPDDTSIEYMLRFANLDTVKWFYCMKNYDINLREVITVICDIDLLEFMFRMHGTNNNSLTWDNLVCRNHFKKRDKKTLEYMLTKTSDSMEIYRAKQYSKLHTLLRDIVHYLDDAFMQWLINNYPDDIRCYIKKKPLFGITYNIKNLDPVTTDMLIKLLQNGR